MTLSQLIQQQCTGALQTLFSSQISQIPSNELAISPATNNKFGHYQFNGAMKLAKVLGAPPRNIAEQIRDALLAQEDQTNPIFTKIEVAGPGFINLTINSVYLAALINSQLRDPRHGCQQVANKPRVVICTH